MSEIEKGALVTAAAKLIALRNAILYEAPIALAAGELHAAFEAHARHPIHEATLNKASNRKISKARPAYTLARAIYEQTQLEILPRPTRLDATDWATLCAHPKVSGARERASNSAKRLLELLDQDEHTPPDPADAAPIDGSGLLAPVARPQELTDRLVRMWFFWGGHNTESHGERRFMIQLQFDTETDVVEGQNCEFRLNRCRIEVSCRQAHVRHDPESEFQIERHDGGKEGVLISSPDTGGFGAATSAGWSIATKNPFEAMQGKFNAEPFGVIVGTRMQGDSAKLYFRLRDLNVSGISLPHDDSGERIAEQWLRRCMIPSAVGGRVVVSAQEISDEI